MPGPAGLQECRRGLIAAGGLGHEPVVPRQKPCVPVESAPFGLIYGVAVRDFRFQARSVELEHDGIHRVPACQPNDRPLGLVRDFGVLHPPPMSGQRFCEPGASHFLHLASRGLVLLVNSGAALLHGTHGVRFPWRCYRCALAHLVEGAKALLQGGFRQLPKTTRCLCGLAVGVLPPIHFPSVSRRRQLSQNASCNSCHERAEVTEFPTERWDVANQAFHPRNHLHRPPPFAGRARLAWRQNGRISGRSALRVADKA